MNSQLIPPANYEAYPGAEVKLARLQQLAKFLKFRFKFFSLEFLSNQGKNWECSTRPQIVQKHFQILDFSTSKNINSYGLC